MLHGLFTAIPSAVDTGTLSLVRRCSALSCSGHCMCAPHGFHGCDVIGSTCSDKSGKINFQMIACYYKMVTPILGCLTSIMHLTQGLSIQCFVFIVN